MCLEGLEERNRRESKFVGASQIEREARFEGIGRRYHSKQAVAWGALTQTSLHRTDFAVSLAKNQVRSDVLVNFWSLCSKIQGQGGWYLGDKDIYEPSLTLSHRYLSS